MGFLNWLDRAGPGPTWHAAGQIVPGLARPRLLGNPIKPWLPDVVMLYSSTREGRCREIKKLNSGSHNQKTFFGFLD